MALPNGYVALLMWPVVVDTGLALSRSSIATKAIFFIP